MQTTLVAISDIDGVNSSMFSILIPVQIFPSECEEGLC